ncbi:MAG TPA: IS630 family transposase [Egibacteraceae bacterium]|nr:IS630 family transposase [Egibacteraceae bacterium]
MAVKALACELPASSGVPLARWHCTDLARAAVEQGITASICGSTIWRWLSADAIQPWRHRSWIFPRDPDFATKAGRVLDLYARRHNHRPLGPGDYVISADEKTSIQARDRKHATTPPTAGQPMRVEHEYHRRGALAYMAAWDVHRAKVFGRCEATSGIASFGRLVDDVMTTEPYASARRVFWVVDNGSSHRGKAAVDRLRAAYSNARMIHLPVHASWLNQIEIYFSVVQRKVLTPNDFTDLEELEARLLGFQDYYAQIATPVPVAVHPRRPAPAACPHHRSRPASSSLSEYVTAIAPQST